MPNKNEPAGGNRKRQPQDLWTETQVRQMLQQLDDSGEPVALFARRQGFKAQRLHWWISRLGWKRTKPVAAATPAKPPVASAPTTVPAFLPVRVVPPRKPAPPAPPRREAGVVVHLGSRQIHLEADFNAEVLRRVIALLEEAPRC